ncbi:MAG: hypothetical protein PWQ11_673 [Candidatus Diapherotrites archaeon]|nr:hypothetical protein [Candidatus Diapherotrites archaeon]
MLLVEPGMAVKELKEDAGITIPPAPEKLDAKVYSVDGGTVTIAYTLEGNEPRIYQIILASPAGDYAKINPFLSALVRVGVRYGDILDLLRSTKDPILASVADAVQDFLSEFGIMPKPRKEFEAAVQPSILSFTLEGKPKVDRAVDDPSNLKICPVCGQRTLKVENGCMTCINPECGYSKCDH